MEQWRFLFGTAILSLISATAHANNIQVSDLGLRSQNPSTGFVQVHFDLSWENSWRTDSSPNNHDAAWVFVKYRVGSGPWEHATLAPNGHKASPGAELVTVPDGVGVFVQRDSNGAGNVNFPDTELRWNYAGDGVANTDAIEIQVFAIEMVYVPEGTFYVGDPESGAKNTFRRTRPVIIGSGDSPNIPYQVTSDGQISYGSIIGFNYSDSNGTGGDQQGPIPEAYPLGFDAFYCMKYEVTQDQWVRFFNTLTATQKTNRDVTGPDGKNSDDAFIRNAVSWPDSGNAFTTNPNLPLNYVNWGNLTAYLDWAGLRMMSEFEYEKTCRGPLPVVPGEFAWGSADIHLQDYNLLGAGTSSEHVSNPGQSIGNAQYTVTQGTNAGPLRVGIFAASAITKSRMETGGSYYGIMELTGNVYERCVTVGTPGGRAYVPNHGDGKLTASGNSNVAAWPGPGNSSYRGGAYPNQSDFLRVSDRNDGANSSDIKNGRIGFRGVRSAP